MVISISLTKSEENESIEAGVGSLFDKKRFMKISKKIMLIEEKKKNKFILSRNF